MSKEGILSNFIDSKGRAQRFHSSIFDSAESFDSESFDPGPFGRELIVERLRVERLTTEGLVAGCGSISYGSAFAVRSSGVSIQVSVFRPNPVNPISKKAMKTAKPGMRSEM